jgi:hypothetical protein
MVEVSQQSSKFTRQHLLRYLALSVRPFRGRRARHSITGPLFPNGCVPICYTGCPVSPFTTTHRTLRVANGVISPGIEDMHNIGLIRQICGKINRETDDRRIEDLLLLLNSVVLDDLQDARVRMEYIRRRYAIAFGEPTAGDMLDGERYD